jgi:hypothetical protein
MRVLRVFNRFASLDTLVASGVALLSAVVAAASKGCVRGWWLCVLS